MHRYDEENLGTQIPPWAQRLTGVILMLAALSAARYLLPSLFDHSSVDANPGAHWFSVVILTGLPFVVILAARLIDGKLEKREVFPPVTLIAAGAFLVAGGAGMLVAAWRDHMPTVNDGLGLLILGSWSIRFGMSRRKRSIFAPGSTQ